MRTHAALAIGMALLAAILWPAPGAHGQSPDEGGSYPLDCEGPAPDAEPGTPEWIVRDTNNLLCTIERHRDKAQHPALAAGAPRVANDAYRQPVRHNGVRFRFSAPEIPGVSAVEVYRPCPTDPGVCPDLPDGLQRSDPPYPVAILLHGGGSRKELHWWSSQSLAEAGYLVVTPDGAGQGSARAILDWLETQPDAGRPIGIAGHSIGGDAAAIVAHSDERIGALVGWDRAGLSSPPDDRRADLPALFLVSDYACPAPLVCPPRPYAEKPDPASRGPKTADFALTTASGADAMQVGLRGTTHFEWVPSLLAGNRYGELLNVYFTIAWFDRYLKGSTNPAAAQDAFARLTAAVFDDSADRHNISQGFWDPVRALESGDPVYGGNVPYSLAGRPVRDRLSFYLTRCAS